MLALLAVATAVTSSPVPSPAVVKEVLQPVIQQAPAVSPQVLALAQVGALAAAGFLTSLVHLIVTRKKLSGNVNRLLFTLFAAVAGVATMFLNGNLSLDPKGLTDGATAVLAFLGSAQGMKMLTDFIGSLQTTTDDSGAAVPLATDGPDAAV